MQECCSFLRQQLVTHYTLGEICANTANFVLHSCTRLLPRKAIKLILPWYHLSPIKYIYIYLSILKSSCVVYQQVTLPSEVNIVYSSFKSEWLLTGLPQDDLIMNHLWAFIPQKSRWWWLLLRNKRQLRSKVDTWGSDWIALWMHNFVYFLYALVYLDVTFSES